MACHGIGRSHCKRSTFNLRQQKFDKKIIERFVLLNTLLLLLVSILQFLIVLYTAKVQQFPLFNKFCYRLFQDCN